MLQIGTPRVRVPRWRVPGAQQPLRGKFCNSQNICLGRPASPSAACRGVAVHRGPEAGAGVPAGASGVGAVAADGDVAGAWRCASGNLIGSVEALNAGVTTIFDWCNATNIPAHADAAIAALQESGIRAMFAYGPPSTPEMYAEGMGAYP